MYVDDLVRDIRDLRRLVPMLTTGRVSSLAPLQVDAGGEAPLAASQLGWWRPVQNQAVWLIIALGRTVVLGPVQDVVLDSTGIVASTPPGGATVVAVTVSGTTFNLPWVGTTPIAGDRVGIAWNYAAGYGDGIVIGKTGQAPTVVQPPPPPEPDEPPDTVPRVTSGVTTVPAIDIRTWRGNGWRGDTTLAFQGDWSGSGENTGFFFYGSGFDQFAGASITAAEVFMRRRGGGAFAAEAPRFRRHTAKTRGGGKPTLVGAVMSGQPYAINAGGWWGSDDLRAIIATTVASGGGLAVEASGRSDYASWAGLAGSGKDPSSGAVRVHWERSN